MFPFRIIEIGNALTQSILVAGDTTTTKTLTTVTTASVKALTQHLAQQQDMTTDIIWRNSFYMENFTQTIPTTQTNGGSSDSNGLADGGGEMGFSSDSFDTDSVFAYVPPLQRPETIFVTILFLVIFIVGVLGNGTLVIIFFRHRSMRNIPNTYTLSLALADLLVIIVCVPLAMLVYTTDSWTLGKTMCQVTEFSKDVSIGVSVFTLTALSGDRYCAIVNPFKKFQPKPLTIITAGLIWLLSMAFATPSLIMSDLQHILIDEKTNLTIIICTPFGQQRNDSEIYARYVVVTKAFVYYLLPLFIIGVLYMMTAKRLHISAREMPGETLSMRAQVRGRRYVARMVMAFVGVFFICFFPYHLFELWFHLNPTAREDFDDFWHTIRIIGFCTYFLNSCLNPVALYCVSGVFRLHFNRYLCCFCFKRQVRMRQHSTATGVVDTSTLNLSIRSAHPHNRASVRFNKAHCVGGSGAYNHHSQRCHSIMQHQHNGTSAVGSGKAVSIGVDNGRLTSATALAQSGVILNDKR